MRSLVRLAANVMVYVLLSVKCAPRQAEPGTMAGDRSPAVPKSPPPGSITQRSAACSRSATNIGHRAKVGAGETDGGRPGGGSADRRPLPSLCSVCPRPHEQNLGGRPRGTRS